jgi:hypothetical protein
VHRGRVAGHARAASSAASATARCGVVALASM